MGACNPPMTIGVDLGGKDRTSTSVIYFTRNGVVIIVDNYAEAMRAHAERTDEHMRLMVSNSMLVKALPPRPEKPKKKYWVQERGAQWKANRMRHSR